MPTAPPPQNADDPLAVYEQVAAEFLAEEGEVANRDNSELQLDRFTDAALADALVTARSGRRGKLDFGRLVEAFGRLRT
jgi:hypothetical protein